MSSFGEHRARSAVRPAGITDDTIRRSPTSRLRYVQPVQQRTVHAEASAARCADVSRAMPNGSTRVYVRSLFALGKVTPLGPRSEERRVGKRRNARWCT